MLLGSPRKNGNTAALARAAADGAREAGADVETFWLRDMKITPCLGCGGCNTTGRCVVDDDMAEVYDAVDRADRLIIASPVYYYGVTGWAKAAIDRFQPYWAQTRLLKRPPSGDRQRWGAFLSLAATRGRRLFEGAIATVKYCLLDAGFRYAGHVLLRGIEQPGDIEKHPEHLERARALGRLLVSDPGSVPEYEA
jgi:multimeric flavodoxin WrbA